MPTGSICVNGLSDALHSLHRLHFRGRSHRQGRACAGAVTTVYEDIALSHSVRGSLVEAPQFAAPAAFPLGQQLRQLAVEAAAVLEVDRRLDGIGEQVQGMDQAQ